MGNLLVLTNLNPSGLSELIGVSPSTVARIVKGHVCPSYDDMHVYVSRAGYKITENELKRPNHLRGYLSAAEIGEVINRELAGGLSAEKLRTLLRVVPKLVYDWRRLSRADIDKMMLPQPRVAQREWQALLEGIVQFFAHSVLLEDAPAWTRRTHLDKLFVPRAAVREIGPRRYVALLKKLPPEFSQKNILFTRDEMQLL
jgi:hypothetical protein